MWWNLDCIAHQIYAQGDTTWTRALHQAQAVKDRREREWDWEDWNEPAPADPSAPAVVPARSARHRFLLEERQRAETTAEPAEEDARDADDDKDMDTKKKKKKKRRHHKGGSDASAEVDRTRRRRKPPTSDESDGGGHKAKRRGGEKSDLVWIQVRRSDLKAS